VDFRYLLVDDDEADSATLAAANERYERHLAGLDFSDAGDLETYFRRDFFHDGAITSVRLDERMRDVVVDLTSLSFWLDGYRESAVFPETLGFRATFVDVAWMQLATRRINDINDPMDDTACEVEFMRSEIDGLSELIEFYDSNYGVCHHSLVIESCPFERSIALVFRRVDVRPHDPATIEALLSNPRVWTGLYPEMCGR
jgi:hypothetical protein